MIEKLLSVLAPHHCVGCRTEGTLLCAHCKYYCMDDTEPSCVVCHVPTALTWLCNTCKTRSPVDDVWISGSYEGALKKLVWTYKFERAKSAHTDLAELLDATVPQIFTTAMVVSVPTISRHIRQRGYDHAAHIAKQLAKKRNYAYSPALSRVRDFRQVGASRQVRQRQAAEMFAVSGTLPANATVLLVDDVITTGSTVMAAAHLLKSAGAKHVFVAACAHEKLQ